MGTTSGYMAVGGVAALVTFVLTPLVGWIGRKCGWVVQPDERRVHTRPTPVIGGLAMFAGFLAAMWLAVSLDRFSAVFAGNSEPLGVVIACGLVFLVGFIDDIFELSAPAKVTGIVAAGLVLVAFGVTMFYFRVPFLDVFVLSDDWSPLITVLWLLGMTQAVNLIDGLDGLAAGIVAIAAGSFFLYSQRLTDLELITESNLGPLLAVIAAGICLGFLPYNFNPARIFMGDGGALFLGSLLAVSTSVVGGRADPSTQQDYTGQTFFFFAPLFIPLFILGVPILDTLFAILRRASRRQGLATADKGHLHHRLMNLGHGQRRSVLILWLWTALLSGFVLYPVFTNSGDAIAPIAIVALGLLLYTVLHPQFRRVRDARTEFARTDGGDSALSNSDRSRPQPGHAQRRDRTLDEMYDVAVVGGGIIGLATALAVTEKFPGAGVIVIEKESQLAFHQTGNNSGVLHSGIYYKPGSLKATYCREGNAALQRFCDEHGIAYDICGKVIVATDEAELPRMESLAERAMAHGLECQRLGPAGLKDHEPHVAGIAGLYLPSTGITDYKAISRTYADLVTQRGGSIRLGTRVTGIRHEPGRAVLSTSAGDVSASMVVNCAGLHSDRIAKLAGADLDAKIVPFRGEYYELAPTSRSLVRGLIYPVPNPDFPFLGVHFTRMIDGAVHAGPNAVLALKREGYRKRDINLRDTAETLTYPGFLRLARKHFGNGMQEVARSFSKHLFLKSLQRLVPDVRRADLVPSHAGVRAQALTPQGGLVDDFLIVQGERSMHVCNAPSPAATSSLEIGKAIAAKVSLVR